jgi:glyoxylase-like metal-dependent hydrolase (beta-lactamase superfamily II)
MTAPRPERPYTLPRMPVTRNIGAVRVTALLDGVREIGPFADHFPSAPADALLGDRVRHPDGDGGAWLLHVRVWLIRHPAGLILFDTGVGPPSAPAFAWFGEGGRLRSELAAAETDPGEVDTVVISHVHDDHIGGTVTPEGNPAFPAARYVLQRADWDWQRASADDNEEDEAIWQTLLAPLERADVVDLVEGDHVLAPGIEARHSPGHTPGHQVILISTGDQRLLITADTFLHPAQLAHPEWYASSDTDPDEASARRRAILAELAARPATTVAPTHFPEAFGTVEPATGGLPGWKPLER